MAGRQEELSAHEKIPFPRLRREKMVRLRKSLNGTAKPSPLICLHKDTDSDSSFCVVSSASPASSSASLSDSPHKYPPTHHSSSSMTARISSSALKDENSKLQRQVQELSDRLRRAEEILRAQSEKEKAMRGSVQVLRREASHSHLPVFSI